MSYDAQEASVADGRPYFLYQFARGATTTRLVSAPEQVTVGGHDWTPSSISHDIIEQTGDVERSELQLTFPISDTFGFALLSPQTQVMTITIFRSHYSDGSHQLRQYWKGRVVGAVSGGSTIKVKTENVFTSLRRPGCRVRVQRTCRHDLYGLECGLDIDDFAVSATITAIAGLSLTVPEATDDPDGEYTAGILKWNGLYGFVQSHVGTTLRLVSEIPGLEDALGGGDQSAFIYRGCDRNLIGDHSCKSFPNVANPSGTNTNNFGGFRWIPKLNPFNNSIV